LSVGNAAKHDSGRALRFQAAFPPLGGRGVGFSTLCGMAVAETPRCRCGMVACSSWADTDDDPPAEWIEEAVQVGPPAEWNDGVEVACQTDGLPTCDAIEKSVQVDPPMEWNDGVEVACQTDGTPVQWDESDGVLGYLTNDEDQWATPWVAWGDPWATPNTGEVELAALGVKVSSFESNIVDLAASMRSAVKESFKINCPRASPASTCAPAVEVFAVVAKQTEQIMASVAKMNEEQGARMVSSIKGIVTQYDKGVQLQFTNMGVRLAACCLPDAESLAGMTFVEARKCAPKSRHRSCFCSSRGLADPSKLKEKANLLTMARGTWHPRVDSKDDVYSGENTGAEVVAGGKFDGMTAAEIFGDSDSDGSGSVGGSVVEESAVSEWRDLPGHFGDDSEVLPADGILPGILVRLEGLKARPVLNGLFGRAIKFDEKKERWQVCLVEHGDNMLLKVENLVPLCPDEYEEVQNDVEQEELSVVRSCGGGAEEGVAVSVQSVPAASSAAFEESD